jgi:hypothetical protein
MVVLLPTESRTTEATVHWNADLEGMRHRARQLTSAYRRRFPSSTFVLALAVAGTACTRPDASPPRSAAGQTAVARAADNAYAPTPVRTPPYWSSSRTDTFDLHSIAERPLPARYAGGAWQWVCPVDVERAVLLVGADSTLWHEAYGSTFCEGEQPTERSDRTPSAGNYITAGDSLELGVDLEGNFVVLAAAFRRGDTLDVRDPAGLVLRYVQRGSLRR